MAGEIKASIGTPLIIWNNSEFIGHRKRKGKIHNMIIVYGLKNCDTCRSAQKWLKSETLKHHFIDIRSEDFLLTKISEWESRVGWEILLNRRSTTWRGLSEEVKNNISRDTAITLMTENPTLIKRPVFETDKGLGIGFKGTILYPDS